MRFSQLLGGEFSEQILNLTQSHEDKTKKKGKVLFVDGCALKRHTEDTVLNHLVLSNANKDFLSSDKLGDVILLCSL